MSQSMIQIPISTVMKRKAENNAQAMGYSSVAEMLTKFVLKIATKNLKDEKVLPLSKKAIDRYDKMEEDFKNGKNWFLADGIDDLIKQLSR